MPKANEVASQLRAVADALDKQPDAEIVKPMLHFYHGYSGTKEEFLSLARVFPRPFDKGDGYNHTEYTLTHDADALQIYASIDRSTVCRLVKAAQPAEYECEPLLNQEEEQQLA